MLDGNLIGVAGWLEIWSLIVISFHSFAWFFYLNGFFMGSLVFNHSASWDVSAIVDQESRFRLRFGEYIINLDENIFLCCASRVLSHFCQLVCGDSNERRRVISQFINIITISPIFLLLLDDQEVLPDFLLKLICYIWFINIVNIRISLKTV
jgi:hypothetical protein